MSPTRLALALSGGPPSEVQQEVAEGYVIVETNYRVQLCFILYCWFAFPLPEAVCRYTHSFSGCVTVAFGGHSLFEMQAELESMLAMLSCHCPAMQNATWLVFFI